MTITRKGASPIKLWFDSPEEMYGLSNKREALAKIFAIMNYRKIGRIDTLELFATILISLQGKFEIIIQNIMAMFCFHSENDFSKDEFHFFLDCLTRGLNTFAIPMGHKSPINSGRRLKPSELEILVAQIFPKNIAAVDVMERT